MIFGVLNKIDTQLRDTTVGANALGINELLKLVDTAYGTQTAPVKEILTWDQSKLPSEMKLPAVQLVWKRSPVLQLNSQSKWRGQHSMALYYWTEKLRASEERKQLAIMASAFLSFLDRLDNDASETIQGIQDVAAAVSGWELQGRTFTWMEIAFTAVERDENPV